MTHVDLYGIIRRVLELVSPYRLESSLYSIASEKWGFVMGTRGKKECSGCGEANGARAYNCKKCGNPFKMKNGAIRYSKRPIEDWTTLEEGDCIRVLSRSGDYYYKQNGDKVHWTTAGKYIVKSLTIDNEKGNCGICCYGLTNKNGGYHWLYMGKERPQEDSDISFHAPHKVVRIKDPRR